MEIRNLEIRNAAKAAGVRLWQIAEACQVNECTFSRKLRKELPLSEKAKILTIIQNLAAGNQGVV